MKYILLLFILIVNVYCLAENDEKMDCAYVTISAEYDTALRKTL
jgi:hypothetical protein